MLVFCVTSEESPQIGVLKFVIMDKCLSFFFLAKIQCPDKSNLGKKDLFLLEAKGTVHRDGEVKAAGACSSCPQSKKGKGCSAFFLHQQSPGSLTGDGTAIRAVQLIPHRRAQGPPKWALTVSS